MKTILLVLVIVSFLLTGCASQTETAAAGKPTAPEEFREDGKYGLRQGKNIITDAIWDDIHTYTIGGKQYHRVTLEHARGDEQHGLLDAQGNMLLLPEYEFMVPIGDYIECRKKGQNRQLIDLNTMQTVLWTDEFISDARGKYVITHTSSVGSNPVYTIRDVETDSILYKTSSGAEGVSSRYYEDLGFLLSMTYGDVKHQTMVLFNGKSVSGTSIRIEKEQGLVLAAAKRDVVRDGYLRLGTNYYVYTLELEKVGDFTVTDNSLDHMRVNAQGHTFIVGDALTPEVDPGYVYIDLTDYSYKPISGAVDYYGFSDGMAVVRNSQGKYGYINDLGEMVYHYQFDDAESFENGKAQAVLNYKKVILDKNGNISK